MKANSARLLSFHFERKKYSRPSFSLRAFAKLLKISPSFASGMITGRKTIPSSRVEQISEVLELDYMAKSELKNALAAEALKSFGDSSLTMQLTTPRASQKYKLAPKSQRSILGEWYYVAILDLTTCSNFQGDTGWIASRLGISKYQAEFALKQLQSFGVLRKTAEGFEKVETKMRLAFRESEKDIRKFHSQMLEKAKAELLNKTSLDDFKKREITGITIAANPKNLERARIKLTEALHEVAEILSEGQTTDLYQINAQLFTLLRT